MPEKLQQAITSLASNDRSIIPEIPTAHGITGKFANLSTALSGKGHIGEQLTAELNALNQSMKEHLNTPLPTTAPQHGPSQDNTSAPSLSK